MTVYKIRSNNTAIRIREDDMVRYVILALTLETYKWAEGLDSARNVRDKAEAFRKGKMVLSERWDGSDYEFYKHQFLKGLKMLYENRPDCFKPNGKENEVEIDLEKMTEVELDEIIQYGIYKTVMWG